MAKGKDSFKEMWRRADRDLKQHAEELASRLDESSREERLCFFFSSMAFFYRYSLRNQMLIHQQRPYATSVQTRRAWEKEGRWVREGEQPIFIWAPASSRGFPWQPVDVFDVGQTDGAEGPPHSVREASVLLPSVEAAAERLGTVLLPDAPLFAGDESPTRVVIGRSKGGYVQVHPGLGPLDRIAALVHEYAHELLHWSADDPPPLDYVSREIEAESTSYVVVAALGLGHLHRNDPSWKYLCDRGVKGKEILALLSRISAASGAILEGIGGRTPKPRIPKVGRANPPERR